MPHRVNQKGDIGTAKLHSDSYDAHNMYLTEEGWVYRHFKTSDKSMWWDEIIVAGQVKPDMIVHGKTNDDVTLTNPMKLGSDPAPLKFQGGSGAYDFEYAGQPGHAPNYTNEVVDLADKTMEPGASYRVPGYAQGIPTGWTGVSDPSMVPEKPPFVGDDYQSCNEYNISVTPLPTPGRDTDPRSVVEGVPDGTCDSVTLSPVSITPTSATVGDTLTASGGQPLAPTDGETTPPATVTYTWNIPGGTTATGDTVVTSVAGTYTVTASVEGGSKTSPGVTVEAAPAPPALSIGAPQISAWIQTESLTQQTFTAQVTEAENSESTFSILENDVAGRIYTDGNTANATITYAAPTLTVVVNHPDSDIYSIIASPLDITGTATSTETGNTEELPFIVSPVVVTSDDFSPTVTPSYEPADATAATVTSAKIAMSTASRPPNIVEATLTVIGDDGVTLSTGPGDGDGEWKYDSSQGWENVTYEYEARYKLFSSGSVSEISLSPTITGSITLPTTLTPATPVTVGGYYPLYTTEADSNAHSGGDGTSHTHTLSNTTYYMPNGLTLGTTMWHGDYDNFGNTGGGSSY